LAGLGRRASRREPARDRCRPVRRGARRRGLGGGRPHAQTGGAARQNGRTPRRRRRTRNASARAVLTDYCENRVTSWRVPEIRTPLLGVRAIVSASSSARRTSSRRGGGAISQTSFRPPFAPIDEKETDPPLIR